MSLVSQEPVLFATSIFENICDGYVYYYQFLILECLKPSGKQYPQKRRRKW
jgi:hypothetical protein